MKARPRAAGISLIAIAGIALSLMLAACGGGGSSSSSSSQSTTTSEGKESAKSTSEPTGTPVKIMDDTATDTPLGGWPGAIAAAEGAALAINEEGGINGHPLELIFCNSKFQPNLAAACARKAVSEKVAAYTGANALGTVSMPILEKAGIPSSTAVSSAPEVQGDYTYPITGLGVSGQLSTPYGVAQLGAKSVVIIGTNSLEVPQDVKLSVKVAEHYGLKVEKTILVPPNQTTFGDVAAQLQEIDPEGIAFLGSGAQNAGIVQAATQVGFEPKGWVFLASAMTVEVAESLEEFTDAAYFVGTVPAANATEEFPAMATFNEESEKAAENGVENTEMDQRDEIAVYQWLTLHMLAEVASEIEGEITGPAMKKALETAEGIDVEGLFEWSGTAPGLKEFPAIKDGGAVYFGPVKGGFMVPESNKPVPVLEEVGF